MRWDVRGEAKSRRNGTATYEFEFDHFTHRSELSQIARVSAQTVGHRQHSPRALQLRPLRLLQSEHCATELQFRLNPHTHHHTPITHQSMLYFCRLAAAYQAVVQIVPLEE